MLATGLANPVFRNFGLGAIRALVDEILGGTIGADHLHAKPIVVPGAMIVRIGHEQQIRLADAKAQGSVEHLTADVSNEEVEHQEQEP